MIKFYIKFLFFVLIGCGLTSCASLFNSRVQTVKLRTAKPMVLVYKADTIKTYNNRAFLPANRQHTLLNFTILTDTGAKMITVKPALSFAYWSNIFMYGGIPGLLIDLTTVKRWGYPDVYLNQKDTIGFPRPLSTKVTVSKKGDFLIHMSLPLINGFNISPDGEAKRYLAGGFGFSAGLDYFYSDKQFFNASATMAVDGPHFYQRNEHEHAQTQYLSLTNNHIINRFVFGYGLAYSYNKWDLINPYGIAYFGERYITTSEGRVPETKSNNAFGLMLTSHFKIVAGLSAGVVYRPTYIRFGADNRYEHLLSFDVAYKIPINRHMFDRPQRTRPSRREIIDRRRRR